MLEYRLFCIDNIHYTQHHVELKIFVGGWGSWLADGMTCVDCGADGWVNLEGRCEVCSEAEPASGASEDLFAVGLAEVALIDDPLTRSLQLGVLRAQRTLGLL